MTGLIDGQFMCCKAVNLTYMKDAAAALVAMAAPEVSQTQSSIGVLQ